ncbi:MAG: discoidin domain-containing protein [Verrucomicrobia bacterium]|nr:discoidin domain-containing protein [Verrucomicrobiota bacterium]
MNPTLLPLATVSLLTLITPMSEVTAQLLWNPPPNATQYNVPTGAEQAEWLRSSVSGAQALWWNGSQNVVAADNSNVVFEGQGNVGPASGSTSSGNSGRANTITFRNLSGPYTLRMSPWLGSSIHVNAGVEHDVVFQGQIQFSGAGTRTVSNNGNGLLHITNGFSRQLTGSGRTLIVDGSGTTRVDGALNFSIVNNDNAQLIKNGSGRLELSHSTYANLQLGITHNAGELYFSNPTADIIIPEFTWTDGTLVYTLSNTVANNNRPFIQGNFTRGGNGPFIFDFQNSGTDRTYTLLLFASTNFELSDFEAINVAPGGFFSWGTEVRGETVYQSLRYTVTVPFDPGPEPEPEPEPEPDSGPILSVTPVNLALNRPATSGTLWSESSQLAPAYTPERAFDGNTSADNSRWIGTGLPNWIEVDLGWNYQISGLRFWTGTANNPFPITGYNLQFWNGNAWTTLFSRTDSNNNGFEEVSFPAAVAGNRVRFNITALRDDNITRLYELEILGVVHDLYHTQLLPASGGSLLDVSAPLAVVFSDDVTIADTAGIVLRNLTTQTDVPLVSATVLSDTLSLAHGGLTSGHRYAVHLPAGVVALQNDSNILNGPLYWEFTTLPATPQVSTFTRDAISISADLRYTFDRDIVMADASGIRILLAEDFSEVADVSVSVTNDRVLNIAHAPFTPGTRYIVEIPAGSVQAVHNGLVNQTIRRTFFSSRYNLFDSNFVGSLDGFSTAATLGFLPSNQSWGLRTNLPGPARDFSYIEAGSRNDDLDFLLSPMIALRAGTEYTLSARTSLGAIVSVGLTATPSRSDIDFLDIFNDAPSGPNGRTLTFTPEEDGDYHVIFYQTAGNANQSMQMDRIQLNRRVLPALEWQSPIENAQFTESEAITLQVLGFAYGTTVHQVQFFDGNILIGTATETEEGLYSLVWNSRSPGTRDVTAVLTDHNGNTISRAVALTITFNDGTLPQFVEWNFNGSAQGWSLGTFTYNNNRLNVGANWTTTNPWASSPVVFLKAGEEYTLEFKARITSGNDNTFQMRANALRQPGFPSAEERSGEMAFTVGPYPSAGGREFETIRRTFSVTEDGPYHITFYPHTSAGSLFLGIQIDDVRLIGDLNAAPAATWATPSNNVRTLAGANILLRALPTDADGFITRVAYVLADGSLLTPDADLSSAPWEYNWQNVPEGEYEVFIYVEDNGGGFAFSTPRTITVLPNQLNISTYLGAAGTNDTFSGAAHQSDGTIVLTGIVDPTLFPGTPPIHWLNGSQSGQRGVVVRLSSDAQQVLGVTVVGNQALDLAIDAEDRIYVAAGTAGAVVLDPTATQVLFSATYPTRLAHRIDAAPGGAFAVVASTQTDWLNERIGNVIVPIYDAAWQLQSSLGGPAFTRDLAICEINEIVVLIGFKNIVDMDMPPWSSQFGETNPVDIPILIGRNFDGTLRWRGYDWEKFVDNPERHLNSSANNMADTRGHRIVIGPDGYVYAAFEFDGGNHPLRYSPLNINENIQNRIVGGDNFHNAANTGTLPKVFVGRFEINTGEMLLGQQLINRNAGNVESTLRIKNGALFVDNARFIHLSGTSASGLPMTLEPLVGVNYSGGAWYMVLSPDMRSRELVTRFGSGGFDTYPSNAGLSVSSSGQTVLAGFSESPILFPHNAWQSTHSNPVVGMDALLTVGHFTPYFNFQIGEHPRLFFNADELAQIRNRLDREPFSSMLNALLDNLDQADFYRPIDINDPRARALRANGLAYAYALTGDDSFAAAARADIEFIFAQISPTEWVSTNRGGLEMYGYATHIAIAYDLCANSASWDPGFNFVVSRRLVDLANVIVDNGGTNQPANVGSNWHAARGSSAGLAFLATDHIFNQSRLDASWNRVNQYLALNRGNRPSVGWNPEGFGYTAIHSV